MNAQDKTNPPKIFVYGTLKPGGRNYFLAQGVTHTEDAYLVGYSLLHFEPEGYPAMVPSSVAGEDRVYGVVLTFADFGAALPEFAVHAWDLAQSTGSTRPLDDEVATHALAFMSNNLTPENRSGAFKPAVHVDDDRSVHERLAAFAGRTPRD